MGEIKTIGVLTSGGDAPGMNAAIRAIVRTAIASGLNVKGIMRGYAGLLNEEIIDMDKQSVSEIMRRGGTILYTARCKEFMTEEGQQKAAADPYEACIDGLIVIGGDGSFRGAQKLSALGINTIGIPGTIDLDIACTDYTIGFDDGGSIRLWKPLTRSKIHPCPMSDAASLKLWAEMQVILPFGAKLPTVRTAF